MAAVRGWEKGNISRRDWRPVPRPDAEGGEFRISCFASHMLTDDPIVFPGQQGKSHHHTFFGGTGVDAFTRDTLTSKRSTCAGGDINRTAYWVPSMIDTRYGRPVIPTGMAVYYKGTPDVIPPRGLRFIAGNPTNAAPRDPDVFPGSLFTCFRPDGSTMGQGAGDEIPVKCPVGSTIVWTLHFPNCWNGRDLDSHDHKSHMAGAGGGAPGNVLSNGCPGTHPVRLFDLTYQIHYAVEADEDLSRWRLASDMYNWNLPAGYSAHGDWWNGWQQNELEAIKRGCHDARADCGQDNLPDGRRLNQ
jgi:hypothetical protein